MLLEVDGEALTAEGQGALFYIDGWVLLEQKLVIFS